MIVIIYCVPDPEEQSTEIYQHLKQASGCTMMPWDAGGWWTSIVGSPGKFPLLGTLLSTTFSEHVHWESFCLLSKGPLIGTPFRVKKWGKGRIWYRREQPKYFHLGAYWIFIYFMGRCIFLCLRRFIRGSRVRKSPLYLFCSQCC